MTLQPAGILGRSWTSRRTPAGGSGRVGVWLVATLVAVLAGANLVALPRTRPTDVAAGVSSKPVAAPDPAARPVGADTSTTVTPAGAGWASVPVAARGVVSQTLGQTKPELAATHTAVGAELANPAQGLTGTIDGSGITVTGSDATVGVSLESWGRPTRQVPAPAGTPVTEQNQVSVERSGIREWFVNGLAGIQQNFTIATRPDGSGPLEVRLGVSGGHRIVIDADRDGIAFAGTGLRYDNLYVHDATGRELPAEFTRRHAQLTIEVDDTDAIYPITVDPTFFFDAYLKASNVEAGDSVSAVAVSGDTLVVGAQSEDSCADGVNADQTSNGCSTAGAVYVFVRSGGTWSQQAYLKASNSEANDDFGIAVGVDGDTIVVGARGEASCADGVDGDQANNGCSSAGAAYVFQRSGELWSQQAYLKASNSVASSRFGFSVAVADDLVVVGSPGERSCATGIDGDQTPTTCLDSGAAYAFVRSGATWSQQAYLKASNAEDRGDHFGYSVGVSGDTAVVGATNEWSCTDGVEGDQANNGCPGAGAAYVFIRDGTLWSQQAYLKASNSDAYDLFAHSVAVSEDTIVIGAGEEDSCADGVGGNQADNACSAAGAVYVFLRSGESWSQQAYLKASNSESNDQFGIAVSISRDVIVVGAYGESSCADGVGGDQTSNACRNAGSAYVFVRSGIAWVQEAYLKASNSEAEDGFGVFVSIDEGLIAIAAYEEDSCAVGINGDQANNLCLNSGATYSFASSLGAPTGVLGTSGEDGRVSVSWSAPSNSGPPITDYRVRVFSSTGGAASGVSGATSRVVGSATESYLFTGLTNGTGYTFKVEAYNAFGWGALSAASPVAIPYTVPAAPMGIQQLVSQSGQVPLVWEEPANNGAGITDYRVSVFSADGGVASGVSGVTSRLVGSKTESFTFTGLTNGTGYTFKVEAYNASGWGPASTLSGEVIPGLPNAPTTVGGTSGQSGQVPLVWEEPANNGAGITDYRVSVFAADGGVASGVSGVTSRLVGSKTESFTFTGLTNGTGYTFKVEAYNAAGWGPASSLTPVVMTAAPGSFGGISPTRALDTRTTGPCVGTAGRSLTLAGSFGVPADASAVSLNVTVVSPAGGGFLTVWPAGQGRPLASNLNFTAGQVVPNMVQVKLGAGGAIQLYANNGCPNVVVDVAGYYTTK